MELDEVQRKIYEDHRNGLEFEHDLINRKITWLLTSQSLLFAALGLSLQAPSETLLRIIAGVGLALSGIIAIALAGNMAAKFLVHRDYRRYCVQAYGKSSETPELEPSRWRWGTRERNGGGYRVSFGVRTWTTAISMVMDLAVPAVFIVGWIFVLNSSDGIIEAAQAADSP